MTTTLPAAEPVEKLSAVMRKYWGYDNFLPLQEEAMTAAVGGRDSVVVLPTGGGKSLCYQAPALCLDGLTVVVSPLISLMKDQVDALVACGVPAACVNSTMSLDERREVADRVREGQLKLLYIAPERLMSGSTLDFLLSANVVMAAIDEAHCISSWGHDFRPEYRGLKVFKEKFPGIGVHAYTATASDKVRRDIAEQLGLIDTAFHVGSFDRPNLIYRVERANNRFGQICQVIERFPKESGIVYCISRKQVDQTAAALQELGVKALPYHAGMSDEDRHANQEAFINEECQTIVATIAFGMGIDKSNVRYVIHNGMPKSLENYQQESGRAGRDGLEAECRLLYSGNDYKTWELMISDESADSRQAGLASLAAMRDFCHSVTCRHKAVVAYFGQQLEGDNCGACDVCLGELDLVDEPLVIAQKILSCVVRLEERFGFGYTAKVLAGSSEQRILDQGHDKLSTYGLLGDENQKVICGWIEQLVSQGYAEKVGEYQTISVTDAGWRVLRGEETPRLVKPAEKVKGRSKSADYDGASWEGVDRGLFDVLRELRRQFATEQGVPAYIVFGDATLRDMARRRPTGEATMRGVKGIGEKKMADYGPAFLERIAEYCEANDLSTDVTPPPPSQAAEPKQLAIKQSSLPAFALFREGLSVEQVAGKMNRAISTVNGYLCDYLRHEGITDPSPWVDAETVARVEAAAANREDDRLTPIFEALGGEVPYADIRVVLTCMQHRPV